jgi:hypothetical protein
MLGAVIVEFLELEMGRDTVKLEIQDVMVEHERDSVDDEHCYTTPATEPSQEGSPARGLCVVSQNALSTGQRAAMAL